MMLSDTERQLLKDRILLQSRELSPEPAGEEPLLQPLKGIRYLIFDFYGTLTERCYEDWVSRLLKVFYPLMDNHRLFWL